MISISRSSAKDPKYHTKFFRYEPANLDDFAKQVCTEIWSPLLWKGGHRGKANFYKSCVVALDFDDGSFTLADAKELIDDFGMSHILATTKSHQLAKTTDTGVIRMPVDRFRLIFIAENYTEDREQYEYNMGQLAEIYGCDKSCKDSARFFWPCKDVISVGKGRRYHWQEFPIDYERDEVARERQRRRLQKYPKGAFPSWIRDIFRFGVPVGERHVTCYKLGACLSMMSYTEDEIVNLLIRTKLADIGDAEVRRAVQNGIKAARV